MRVGDQFDQIAPVAEMRIDVEEVLNAVSMIGVEMAALLEDRPDPDRRYAEIFQVAEFGPNPSQRPALPPLGARLRPLIPSPRLAVGAIRAGGRSDRGGRAEAGILLARR